MFSFPPNWVLSIVLLFFRQCSKVHLSTSHKRINRFQVMWGCKSVTLFLHHVSIYYGWPASESYYLVFNLNARYNRCKFSIQFLNRFQKDAGHICFGQKVNALPKVIHLDACTHCYISDVQPFPLTTYHLLPLQPLSHGAGAYYLFRIGDFDDDKLRGHCPTTSSLLFTFVL